jgi:hypothetical protein
LAGAFLLESCCSLLFFAGAILQRARQFLPGGPFLFGSASAFGGSFLPGGALLLTLGGRLVLLTCTLFSRTVEIQLRGAFLLLAGSLFRSGVFAVVRCAVIFLLLGAGLHMRALVLRGRLAGRVLVLRPWLLPGGRRVAVGRRCSCPAIRLCCVGRRRVCGWSSRIGNGPRSR